VGVGGGRAWELGGVVGNVQVVCGRKKVWKGGNVALWGGVGMCSDVCGGGARTGAAVSVWGGAPVML